VVVAPPDADSVDGSVWEQAYTGTGMMLNSYPYDGLPNQQASMEICADLAERAAGGPVVNYRMRDWLISRQRYWGAPIPIIHCKDCGETPVPEEDLPVMLPQMEEFRPDGSGRSPLARLPEFVNTSCPSCGGPAQRETDTMGGFACSSWYFLRFTSPHYHQGPFDSQAMRYWMPVDLYVGGAEHAVLHLLYARFWTKVMADAGLLPFREPFSALRNQGQLLGPDGGRMSKSRGNVVTPDKTVETYGADALRVYEMFMAPFDQDIAWSDEGINGARRFLNRVWNLYARSYTASISASGEDDELARFTHKTIRRVGERIEDFRLNTMISALMEFFNAMSDRYRGGAWHTSTYHWALDVFLILLAPAAPHITEELWNLCGHTGSVHRQEWPAWDADLARDEIVQIPVQVDGRLRAVIEVANDAVEEDVRQLALADKKVQQHRADSEIAKFIYIPGKIINIVTRGV
jgi:leucyl-tRNA synthetase